MKFLKSLIVFFFLSLFPAQIVHANSANYSSFGDKMIDAADAGNEYLVTNFLRNKVSPNVTGEYGTTALMRASLKGHDETVRYLLEAGANVHAKDFGGATALHLAARSGHISVVEMLLKYGANPDARDNEGYSPLDRAILAQDLTIIDSLMKLNPDVEMPGPHGISAVTLASQTNNDKIKKLVVKEMPAVTPLTAVPQHDVKIDPVSKIESKEGELVVGEVEVGEAIEVPEDSDLRKQTVQMSKESGVLKAPTNNDISSSAANNLSAEKIVPMSKRQLSMEVSGFADEEDAVLLWYGISDDKLLDGKQAKLVYDNTTNQTDYKLRFDGYFSPKDVFESCKKVRTYRADVMCYVIHNIY